MRPPPAGPALPSQEPAPLQPGAPVLVLLDGLDESADVRFHGARGEVVAVLVEDPGAQVGPWPLVEVQVEGLGREYFFAHELQVLP